MLIAEPEARVGLAHYFSLYRTCHSPSEPMDGLATFDLF